MKELTETELDAVLERFDQTEPTLQRKIVGAVMVENMELKKALGEAMFSRGLTSSRCVEVDPAGSTYEVDWTDDARRWADLAGVDLNKYDPSMR